MTLCEPDTICAKPVNVKWNVVRGDTSTLRIDFLAEDEVTATDITGWNIQATAYDSKTVLSYALGVTANDGWIVITAEEDITELWAPGVQRYRAQELNFDVQVTFADFTVWTPVIGTISVIADVTGANL